MKKFMSLLFGAILLSILLVGCGNKDTSKDKEIEEDNKQTEVAKERVLTDGLGHEVTVPANPERVIASYLEDYLVALGITPAAQWTVNDGASIQEYLGSYLKDVPLIPYDLPFEAVMSYDPDLIVIGSPETVEGGKYEQYAKIAPTFVLNHEQTANWRSVLETVGEVFDKEEKAKEVLAAYDKKAQESKQKMKDTNGEQSAAAIWVVNNSVFMVSETASSGAVMYGELGLLVPELVKEVSNSATSDWSQVSLEKLAELDADHLFLINSENGSEFFEDPIWQNIKAVKNGNLHEFAPTTSWLYNGPIASEQIIDHVLDSVLK